LHHLCSRRACIPTYRRSLLPSHPFSLFHTPPPTEIYTLSLHDALPIYLLEAARPYERGQLIGNLSSSCMVPVYLQGEAYLTMKRDRKSTRLNSSHDQISYAVFCLKKKKKNAKAQFASYDGIRGEASGSV